MSKSSIKWLSNCILALAVLGSASTYAAVAQPLQLRADYLSDDFKLDRSGKGSVKAELASAARALNSRKDAALTKHTLELIKEDTEKSTEIRNTKGLDAEKLKSEQIQWQSKIAKEELDKILSFHIKTESQLASRLQWFWSNHFSVFGLKRNVRLVVHDYDVNALSPRLMGRFNSLLTEAVLHPAMIIYLDNHGNRKTKGNENLAREILELHTLGVNGGYTQADVQNLARALTGITVTGFRSNFTVDTCIAPKCTVINPAGTLLEHQHHDFSPKVLLGKKYERSDGLEILDMLSDLSKHPSTASFISEKLLRFFLADAPQLQAISNLASVYKSSDGDLTRVYQAILEMKPTATAENLRFSDPFSYLMRVTRLLSVADIEVDPAMVNKLLRDWGQGLYLRITPDGYPLESDYWSSAAALTERLDGIEKIIVAARQANRNLRSDSGVKVAMKQFQPKIMVGTRENLASYEVKPLEWFVYFLVSPDIVFH